MGVTTPQIELPAACRHGNVRGVFAPAVKVHRPYTATDTVRDACVVLVDDMATTGATLEACARATGVRR